MDLGWLILKNISERISFGKQLQIDSAALEKARKLFGNDAEDLVPTPTDSGLHKDNQAATSFGFSTGIYLYFYIKFAHISFALKIRKRTSWRN